MRVEPIHTASKLVEPETLMGVVAALSSGTTVTVPMAKPDEVPILHSYLRSRQMENVAIGAGLGAAGGAAFGVLFGTIINAIAPHSGTVFQTMVPSSALGFILGGSVALKLDVRDQILSVSPHR